MVKFRVIDPNTGGAPDLMSIYEHEDWSPVLLDWAKSYEFVLHQDGQLDLILDDGDIYKCPPERFKIVFEVGEFLTTCPKCKTVFGARRNEFSRNQQSEGE